MLAIVKDQQHVPCGQMLGECDEHRPAGLLVYAQSGSHGQGHQERVSHRRELDEPGSVWVDVHQNGRDAQRQACLANTA